MERLPPIDCVIQGNIEQFAYFHLWKIKVYMVLWLAEVGV